jgi:hypothetical protein
MDAAAWIRSRLVGFTCAACGRAYRRDQIRVLAQREGLFFVSLDCGACATESVAIISLDAAASEPRAAGLSESTRETGRAAAAPLVRASDVLAMHEFLRHFDGDFRGLFGMPRGRPSSSAGA